MQPADVTFLSCCVYEIVHLRKNVTTLLQGVYRLRERCNYFRLWILNKHSPGNPSATLSWHGALLLCCSAAAGPETSLSWFMRPTSDLPPSLPPVTSPALPPCCSLWHAGCWLMMPPRSSHMRNTHHLLQLLSLTTIFEFDGLSNYIPPLFPVTWAQEGYKSSRWCCSNRRGCCGRQTPSSIG